MKTTSNSTLESTDSEPDASAGWRAEYAYQGVSTTIEPDTLGAIGDRLAAAQRNDRPPRYRQKHRRGVTS
jgi:hypothetical protein